MYPNISTACSRRQENSPGEREIAGHKTPPLIVVTERDGR